MRCVTKIEKAILAYAASTLSLYHRAVKAERGLAEVRARREREPALLRHGSGFVLCALMDAVIDRYFPVVDDLEDELERVEEKIFAGSSPPTSPWWRYPPWSPASTA
jgi:Mg2+ and Co2+ transporter CorA